MNTYNLILDDCRNEKMCFNATGDRMYLDLEWIIVKNYDEFVDYITKNSLPEIISFDHDISDFIEVDGEKVERTGKSCAEWLVNYCLDNNLKLPEYYVHSSNPGGAENIIKYLDNFKKFADEN